MKRATNLLERIADPDNLRLAFWKARRGKDGKREVKKFRRRLDENLLSLRSEILSGKVNVGGYRYFRIYDPKERQICAAPFRERVLHHALMNVCHDSFEQYCISDTYACRLGKGTYAALDRARQFHHRYRWYLKLDVRKYFDSIDHAVLRQQLRRRFKEPQLLSILDTIVGSYEASSGKGLPIGNLTSQYFANHYLGAADHYVKETLRLPAYVRYMDDMALWADSKEQLLHAGNCLQAYIGEHLELRLKPFCLNATAKGLPFLGYMLFPAAMRLERRSRERFLVKCRRYAGLLRIGVWTQEDYQRHVLPLLAFVGHALRAEDVRRRGV